MKTKVKKLNLILALLLPILVIMVWQTLYYLKCFPFSQSSSPIKIYKSIYKLVIEGKLFFYLYLSVSRLLTGVFFGAVLGISFGTLSSTKKGIRMLIAPTVNFLSGVPVVVWIPFWVMIFGIGESFKIGMVAISTFFLLFGSVFQTTTSIDTKYLDLCQLYNKNYYSRIKKVYIPYSLYSIFGALRLSLMIGWIVLFFVEYSISFEGKEGLGWFIANSRSVGKIDEEFAGLTVLGITAFILDTIISYFQVKSIKWKI